MILCAFRRYFLHFFLFTVKWPKYFLKNPKIPPLKKRKKEKRAAAVPYLSYPTVSQLKVNLFQPLATFGLKLYIKLILFPQTKVVLSWNLRNKLNVTWIFSSATSLHRMLTVNLLSVCSHLSPFCKFLFSLQLPPLPLHPWKEMSPCPKKIYIHAKGTLQAVPSSRGRRDTASDKWFLRGWYMSLLYSCQAALLPVWRWHGVL